jgi:hypothetical protein
MVDEHLEEWKKVKKQIEDMPVDDELTQEFKTERLKSLNYLISTKEKENAK